MKLNLPSTLTQQAAWTLFFLTLLQLKQTEAGNGFRNCLVNRAIGGENNYDYLVNYFSKNSLFEQQVSCSCCGNSACPNCCTSCDCSSVLSNFGCIKLEGKIYCHGEPSLCGGIIGNVQSNGWANNGTCLDARTATINYINSSTPEGLDKGYAFFN